MAAFRTAQRQAAAALPGVTFVPTAEYWDTRLEELCRLKEQHERDCKRNEVPYDREQPLATPELSAEYFARGGHWGCHYNGSAATYCKVGHGLAQALLANAAPATPKEKSF